MNNLNLEEICRDYDALIADTSALLHSPYELLNEIRAQIESSDKFYTNRGINNELLNHYRSGWKEIRPVLAEEQTYILDSIVALYFVKKKVKTLEFSGEQKKKLMWLANRFRGIPAEYGLTKTDYAILASAFNLVSFEVKTIVLSADKNLIAAGECITLKMIRDSGSLLPALYPYFALINQRNNKKEAEKR